MRKLTIEVTIEKVVRFKKKRTRKIHREVDDFDSIDLSVDEIRDFVDKIDDLLDRF